MLGPTPNRAIARVDVVDVAPALDPAGASADEHAVAAELIASFRRTGFAVITGHQVPAELFATMSEVSEAFFALPGRRSSQRLFPHRRSCGGMRRSIPRTTPRFRGWSPSSSTGRCRRSIIRMAENHYPPRPAAHDTLPRNRPHTDHGVLTLLYRPDEPGGLEVQAQGRWWRVPFLAGSLVLNVGDLLERWTGGVLRATPHRVVTPAGAAAMVRRQSVGYVQQPNPDALVEPAPALHGVPQGLRYRPVRAGVHISRKEHGRHAVAAL
jgi:isopenicillin N synthase-like dioxygenase